MKQGGQTVSLAYPHWFSLMELAVMLLVQPAVEQGQLNALLVRTMSILIVELVIPVIRLV